VVAPLFQARASATLDSSTSTMDVTPPTSPANRADDAASVDLVPIL
jgi:hypothetical protein